MLQTSSLQLVSPLIVLSLHSFEFWSILENSSLRPEARARGTVCSFTPFHCMSEDMADERWKYYFFMKASSKCGFWKVRGMAGLRQIIPKGTKSLKSYFSFHRPLFDTMWDVSIHFHWFPIAFFHNRACFTLKAGRTFTWLWEEQVYSPAWCFKLIHILSSSHRLKSGKCPCGYVLFCLFNSYFLYDMSLAFFLPHFPQQEK